MKRYLTVAALAALISLSTAASAVTVIKIQTANAAGSFSLKYINEVWVPKLEAMTYGNIKGIIFGPPAAYSCSASAPQRHSLSVELRRNAGRHGEAEIAAFNNGIPPTAFLQQFSLRVLGCAVDRLRIADLK